ncbi:alpha/beta fold hydrolase [Sandaracinobacteroides hominis]|uniref:alpha/beta fold hydrolase n=1 Tax=Sandaracinobacteroides hominis TaxID=2780086 RepID=UPI002E2DF399|nr:alpha/beta hydrolase [Sandaracinobacteroides hominis]
MQQNWADRYLWTSDNVRLHYRDYGTAKKGQPALLCLPGLTRNARDFEAFAQHFAPRFRVVTPSFRGRGDSGYARDPLTYVPLTYLQDVGRLMDDARISSTVIVGTSLGGLIGLLLDVTQRSRIAGLVLNDLGPDMEEGGLARVRQQVGRGGNWQTWLIAARDIARRQADIYPGWPLEKWLAYAKRLCRVSREGRIVWDYDPEIAAPFSLPHGDGTSAGALDLWLALDSYKDRPVLSIRGERSDILSAATQAKMVERLPGLSAVTVPRVGHAPTLEEPAAIEALEGFLKPFA